MAYKKGDNKTPAMIEGYINNEALGRKETITDVQNYPITAVPQQSISKVDAEFYGVRSKIDPNDSKKILATYFPYYDKESKLTGYKKRDWTLQKEEKYHFTTVGIVKVSSQLFGQPQCATSGRTLIQVEGEGDVIAARRSMLNSLKGTKWEGKISPNVVGLNCGAGNAQEAIAHNESFVRSFEKYVLGLDSDSATPKEALEGIKKGKEATEDIAAFLLSEDLRVVDYGKYKDPREMFDEGKGVELGKLLSFGHEKYSPEKIISGDDAILEDLLEPLREGHYIERYPELMKKLRGIRQGNELITYAAFSGVGKSTLNREIMWELDRAGYTVGAIFLEEPMKKTQQALLSLEMGIPLPKFRENPLAVATRESVQEAKDKILSNGRTYFLNHFGSLKVEKLMQQVRYLHFICGCQHIFIDHVSMVVAGLDTNERKDLDMLYEELASFMTVNDVTIHAVCHLKRVEDPKSNKKTKDDEDPEPYWREVRKEMLRGSSGIEQMSSIIVMLENQVMPDGTRGNVRSRVEKNREWSYLGICDVMTMKDDGRLHVVEECYNYEREKAAANIAQAQEAQQQQFLEPQELPEFNSF